MLTGRGEDEAQRGEREVQATGADVTIVRCAWFMQIFSEDFLLDSIRAGEVVLPAADDQLDPFVDADDIADVAVAALTEPGHAGQVYELTSPRLLSVPEAVAEIAKASGRDITYVPVSVEDYAAGAADHGAPAELVDFLTYLFSDVLGKLAYFTNTVERVLGRPPRDFTDFATRTAATGIWSPARGPMIDHDVRSPVAEPVRSARHRVDGDGWTGLVLGAALVAMALVAGLCYTFSVAVMPNLADADDRTFVATMQRFNDNPVFQVTFTGALVLTALAAVLQRRHGPGSPCAGPSPPSCSTGSSSP